LPYGVCIIRPKWCSHESKEVLGFLCDLCGFV
jgi:hypothetical protein